jgi:hypothetical protein
MTHDGGRGRVAPEFVDGASYGVLEVEPLTS